MLYPRCRMVDEEPTQRTQRGAEIPVPKRSAWDKVFKRAARPTDASEEALPDAKPAKNGDAE